MLTILTVNFVDIVIATPKQLKVHAEKLQEISWLVIDECDQVFESTARSTYQKQISDFLKKCLSANLSHSFFSATYDGKLESWAKSYFDSPIQINIGVK